MTDHAKAVPCSDDAIRNTARPPATVRPQADPPITAAPADLAGLIVQAKLAVGPSNDVYEREADAVADRVVVALRSSDTDG